MKLRTILILIAFSALLLGGTLMSAPQKQQDGEWRYFGGDAGNTHYSRLTDINKSNVSQLQVAWEWQTGDAPMSQYNVTAIRMEATPLMIDDVLYLATPYHRVVALDAKTGKQLWSYDPHAYELGGGHPGQPFASHRGVATWTDGKQRRIFMLSRGYMYALDAKTGEVVSQFGKNGIVDLTENLLWPVKDRTFYNNDSPPTVYKNIVIVGNSVPDGDTGPNSPSGEVRGYDVISGKLVWDFHATPQAGEFGNDTWEGNSWKYTGHGNVWAPMTLDENRGLVYLPFSSPANDYYGGDRKGNNLFADSIVCLDALTGKRKWHFQVVHHDLWDYDGVLTPTLLTIHVGGKTIDAVAAVSKTGFVYVFDRVTGQPVWPIVERPVPQSDVPGEKTSATQPFPTKPPAFVRQGFTADDVIDLTPEIKAAALEKIKPYRVGPIFNPGSFQGSILLPGHGGGANWGSSSGDPQKGYLFVGGRNIIQVLQFKKEGQLGDANPEGLLISGGLEVIKPPYSTLTAYDLNKGEILWQVPAGETPAALRNNPMLKGVDIPQTGAVNGYAGVMVTASGMVFMGPGDNKFYAFDEDTGKTIWSGDLKAPATGTAMTYRTSDGRQFIVVGNGGGPRPTALTAFALPAK